MYFGGSAISGPWFEFKDLMQLFRFEGHYKDVSTVHTLWTGLKSIISVAFLVIYASILQDVFDFDLNTTITKPFLEDFSWWYQWIYIIGVMLREHAIIMIGFCFMDSGPIVSGLSYNGKDENGNDRLDRTPNL